MKESNNKKIKKIMNAKIIASFATILVVGAAVSAGTVAYFTSQKTISGNTFTAGTLTLSADSNGVYGTGTSLPVITETNMAPGFIGTPKYAAVANTGTLPLNWNFSLIKTSDTPGIGGGNLFKVLKVKIEAVMNSGNTALEQFGYNSSFNCNNTSLNWQPIYGENASVQSIVTTPPLTPEPDADGFIFNGTYPDKMGQLDAQKGVCVRITSYLDANLINALGVDRDDNLYQDANVNYQMVVDGYQTNDPAGLL